MLVAFRSWVVNLFFEIDFHVSKMRKITEKMEMSHRQEINFPIPKLMIVQAQKNEPWPLNSGLQ